MSKFTTVIPTAGPAGNIFRITGTALNLMKQLGLPQEERDAFWKRVSEAHGYEAACAVVREYFPLEGDHHG